jgi:hypothetical protein
LTPSSSFGEGSKSKPKKIDSSNSNTPSLLDLKKITQHIELMIQSMENLSNLKESSLQPKKKSQKQNKFLKISPP